MIDKAVLPESVDTEPFPFSVQVIRMMLPKYIWMFSAKLTSKPWGSSRCWLDFVLASPQAHPQDLQFITERPYRLLEGGDSEDREEPSYSKYLLDSMHKNSRPRPPACGLVKLGKTCFSTRRG